MGTTEPDLVAQFEKDSNRRGGKDKDDEQDLDDEHQVDDFENIDFYAVLNVPRNATATEIQVAYKKLAFTYHPDKQIDPVLKEESQHKFALISMARDTLCDEKQRAIYDRYGINGLTNSQAIINKYEEVDNLLRAMGKIQQGIREEREMDGFTGTGQQDVSIGYFAQYRTFFLERFNSKQQYNIKTGFCEIDIIPSFQHNFIQKEATFGCGTVIRKPISHRVQAICAVDFHQGYPLQSMVGLKTVVTKNTMGQLTLSSMGLHPVEIKGSLTRHINPELSAILEAALSIGGKSGGIILQKNVENRVLNVSVNASTGVYGNGITTSMTRQLPISKRTFISFTVASKGFGFGSFNTSITRRLSKVLDIDFSMKVTKSKFLYVIGIRHKFQSFEIPFPIFTQVSYKHSLLFFTVPSVILSLFKLCVLNPIQKSKDKKNLEEKKEKYIHEMEKEKQRSSIDIQLMKPSVEKKIATEQSKNGLIIQEAWYGVLDDRGRPTDQHPDFPSYIDVTIPLQYLVEDSKLELHANKKSDLLGFWDPRIGEFKRLKVTYFFQGKLHQVVIGDEEYMRLPLRSHLMNN
ncbi:DNAJ heat shock N-terminal domain-containing protein [Cavenderia fasciculata]|uniref:DNAJ heat shock N-terminal domain-containing protein n=1 Tax=Cavenderia fasciculata TaxID=261658 RepID=F4PT48_CACFS|nr:DNAJ heat shock N-terminal domain-containing protein [Cavenderia fasciculata]EGG21624.1 DNAJ heat shock N-terminal domain-containing protein [Cavenderia fasciculata]|eukprot:XP_004359474.1 DNAJ heat shock N-terminal domain-containing protein [Cavenderia fasciculata]